MFCRNCGSELREGALFCPNCGNKVAQAEEKEVIHAPIKEERVETTEKAERKDNTFDIKKYIPIIAVVIVVLVIGIVALGGSKDTPSNVADGDEQNQTETQYDSEQDSESSVDNDVIVKDEQENQIETENTDIGESDSQSGYLEQNGMDVILDDSNNIVGNVSKYTDARNQLYYNEVSLSGNDSDLKFSYSSMVYMEDYCTSSATNTVVICSEEADYMLQVWSYKEGEEEDWAFTDNFITNLGMNYGWVCRPANGTFIEDRNDEYVRLICEIDDGNKKGYEGVLYEKNKGTILHYVYIEDYNIYNDERARVVANSISTEFSQLNGF